jgi:outer membrane lipopolysaccharide assembly protein LptE/RlpB
MTRVLSAALACALVVGSSACGYALAGRGTLPPHIKVIGVPPLVNESQTPEIDQVLTTKLREEFQGRGRYTVKPDATGVDAVLTGTVVNVQLTPITLTANRLASRYAVVVTVRLEFKDLKENKVVWANSVQAKDEYDVASTTAATDVSAFFRQDASLLERLARSFARSVVAAVFDPF